MAPASTGSDSSSRNAVTRIDHTNSGILCSVMPGARMLKMVVMKLIAPRIEEAPAMCSEKIAKIHRRAGRAVGRKRRIERPAAAHADAAGIAFDEHAKASGSAKENGSSQKEMLFMRGNAMSGAPIISGTSQLPKPPIIAGMIMKNTMIRPWPVTKTLKVCGSWKTCRPGYISSARIIIDRRSRRRSPRMIAKTRYIVPMSLWLVE